MPSIAELQSRQLMSASKQSAAMSKGQESFKAVAQETWVTATDTDDGRTLADWMAAIAGEETTFNVMDYGAKGDNAADDTAAINRAAAALLAYVQTIGSQSYFAPAKLYFPPGRTYLVTGSINLQFINGWGWSIEGYGAIIRAACTGKTVFDFLGSRFGSIVGLTIIGDSTNKPAIGIQLARPATSGFGDVFKLLDVSLVGHFTRAAIYNLGSETGSYINVWVWNKDTAGGVGMIIDGLNHLGPITDFTNTTIPTDTLVSCTQHTFFGCSFLVPSGGAPCFVAYSNATQIRFVNGYFAGTGAGLKLIAVAGAGDIFLDIDVDCHFELGTANVEVERTSSGAVTVIGLKVRDINSQASTALVKAGTNISYLKLEDLDIHSHAYAGALVDGPVAYAGQVQGRQVGQLAIGDTTRALLAVNGDLGYKGVVNRLVTGATFTAARTWTLPAANTVPIGWELHVEDNVGTVSSTNTLTLARASSDTINGLTSAVIRKPYGSITLVSDGVSRWTITGEGRGRVGTATPTVTSEGGTLTSASASSRWLVVDGICHFTATITITTAGTGTGSAIIALPFASATGITLAGYASGTGKMLQGRIFASGSTLYVLDYAGSTALADGAVLRINGSYEIA